MKVVRRASPAPSVLTVAPGAALPSGSDVAAPAAPKRFAALHAPDFRALWIGMIVSNAGSQMQNASQAWLVRDLHAEPIYLGLLSLSQAIPMLLLTPLGGVVADRLPRLTLLRFTQIGMLAESVVLATLTLGGWIQFWHILLLSACYSVLLALDNPARQALLPDLVPRRDLTSAISLNSVAWSGSALFGPAIAGLLLAPLGPGLLFALNAATFVAILRAVFTIHEVPREHAVTGSWLRGTTDGFRFTARTPPIAVPLLLVSAANAFGRSYITLMPIFARDVLHAGPEGYGLLLSVPGAGALVGGFGLASLRSIASQRSVSLLGWFGFVAALGAFGLSRNLWLSAALLFVAAVTVTVFNASVATVLQLNSPAYLRGRVMSLMATSNIGLSSLGGMTMATIAGVVSAPGAVVAGTTALVVLGVGALLRGQWRFETPPQDAER